MCRNAIVVKPLEHRAEAVSSWPRHSIHIAGTNPGYRDPSRASSTVASPALRFARYPNGVMALMELLKNLLATIRAKEQPVSAQYGPTDASSPVGLATPIRQLLLTPKTVENPNGCITLLECRKISLRPRQKSENSCVHPPLLPPGQPGAQQRPATSAPELEPQCLAAWKERQHFYWYGQVDIGHCSPMLTAQPPSAAL